MRIYLLLAVAALAATHQCTWPELSLPLVPETFFEMELLLQGQTFKNPFNYSEAHVSVSAPGLQTLGFYDGDSKWRFRVRLLSKWNNTSPTFIVLLNGEGSVCQKELMIAYTAPQFPGSPSVAPNGMHFQLHDEWFFPIGENLCWGNDQQYQQWTERLQKHRLDYVRFWTEPFLFGIETLATGLMHYDLSAAQNLDDVLLETTGRGIKMMLCLDSFNLWRIQPPYQMWNVSVYNAANGGPFKTPGELFTQPLDAPGVRAYLNRLQYYVARYAAFDLFSIELWNEVDITDDYDTHAHKVTAFQVATIQQLKAYAPYHMFTSSYSNSYVIDAYLPQEFSYSQVHSYGKASLSRAAAQFNKQMHLQLQRPNYLGELGISDGPGSCKTDPTGIHLHNALWASLASGAGGGFTWWWDSYVDPMDLYGVLGAAATLVRDVLPKYLRNCASSSWTPSYFLDNHGVDVFENINNHCGQALFTFIASDSTWQQPPVTQNVSLGMYPLPWSKADISCFNTTTGDAVSTFSAVTQWSVGSFFRAMFCHVQRA